MLRAAVSMINAACLRAFPNAAGPRRSVHWSSERKELEHTISRQIDRCLMGEGFDLGGAFRGSPRECPGLGGLPCRLGSGQAAADDMQFLCHERHVIRRAPFVTSLIRRDEAQSAQIYADTRSAALPAGTATWCRESCGRTVRQHRGSAPRCGPRTWRREGAFPVGYAVTIPRRRVPAQRVPEPKRRQALECGSPKCHFQTLRCADRGIFGAKAK